MGVLHQVNYTFYPLPSSLYLLPSTLSPDFECTPYALTPHYPTNCSLTLFTRPPTPYTLHPTPYTLHPTPYTPHPTPYTLHPTPHTLHFIIVMIWWTGLAPWEFEFPSPGSLISTLPSRSRKPRGEAKPRWRGSNATPQTAPKAAPQVAPKPSSWSQSSKHTPSRRGTLRPGGRADPTWKEPFHAAEVYRGASLIRTPPPPKTTIGPLA